MFTTRENLLVNNQFLVTIGKMVYSFAKISNLQDSFEVEAVSQGGANRYPELLPKQKGKAETLILERGVLKVPLKGIENGLSAGTFLEEVLILVLNHNMVWKTYYFDYGYVTKWEVSPLDALGKDVLYQKVEITHSGLKEVSLP